MARKKAKSDTPTFEESLEELKSIVSELENGKLTLSDSLERYELGVKRLSECYHALNEAQRKIEQLVRIDDQGRLITKPFDDSATFSVQSASHQGEDDEESEEAGSLF